MGEDGTRGEEGVAAFREGADPSAEERYEALADEYRRRVANLHNRLTTIGIPPEARPKESKIELPLAELFIPLRLTSDEQSAVSIDLARALSAGGSAVILADPGMGKSTLLAYLALVFAGGARIAGFDGPPRLVPFHISLRDFVRRQKQTPGLSFLDYLEIEAREHLEVRGMHRAFFEATLRKGKAVVLLDGLDEVGNESARHAMGTAIRAFQAEYPDNRFWVTSRVYGYTENVRLPRSFKHYRIARLEQGEIDWFVTRWYEHQITADPREANAQAESLQAAVRRTPSVRRLAGNPLLLTLMAFIHHGLRRLPKDRGELYETCVEMLLKTWREAKRQDGELAPGEALALNVPTAKDYLAHLAFHVQQKNQGGKDDEARGLVSRREAIDALTARHLARASRERPWLTELEARDEMARFLEYICDQTGLVLDRGNDQLSFIHLSFQEYLAAWVFLCGTDLPRGPDFFVAHLGDPAWEEVLLLRLYIVLLGGGGGEREFDVIVGAMLRSLERKSTPEGWLTLARAIRDDLEFRDHDRREILGRAIGYWLDEPAFAGTWFSTLEEVKLFAERARELLRAVIAEARVRAVKPAHAMALLHLETKLFEIPRDAADTLKRRHDVGVMFADLLAFIDDPEIAALLAERGTTEDWLRALRTLDAPEVYRRTVRWMTEPPSPQATEAATAWLWEKVIGDFQSRAAFAAQYRDHPDAMLFDQPGALTLKMPFTSATLPWACLRTLRVVLPSAAPRISPQSLCPSLVEARLASLAEADDWLELTCWIATQLDSKLVRADPPLDRDKLERLAALFVRDFGRDSVRDFVRDFGVDPDQPGWGEAWNRAMEDEANQIRLLERDDTWTIALELWGDMLLDSQKKVTAPAFQLQNSLAAPLLLVDPWSAAASHMLFAALRNAAATYPKDYLPDDAIKSWLLRNPIEVYATALAWEEHGKSLERANHPSAALAAAHAAYASLMTGLACPPPLTIKPSDPLTRFSYTLHDLCSFRDAKINARKLKAEIAFPAPELRPLLQAIGLISEATPQAPFFPTRVRPRIKPDLILFSWLHLSDIHFGHPDVSHHWDQKLVLDELLRDITAHEKHNIPAPQAMLITGDIAYAGIDSEYSLAKPYLDKLATTLHISPDHIFLVPGNHDIDRSADQQNRNLKRLLRDLRDGEDTLDEALENKADRDLLTSRLAAYLSFASAYPSINSPTPLAWSHTFTTRGLPVRLIGLSTPLLAAGDIDHGKLRIGKAALAQTLTGIDRDREFVLVLTHHPLRGGWLADQRDIDGYLQARAHVHLFGHVHEADSEDARSGSGQGLIRVASGAAHGDMLPPGVPASHGYSTGAVLISPEGGPPRLRIWPRRWSEKNKGFRADVDNVPEGRDFAEHPLPGLRVAATLGG